MQQPKVLALRNPQEIKAILEDAFLPLICNVEIRIVDGAIHFIVENADGDEVSRCPCPIPNRYLRSSFEIESLVCSVRGDLERRGYRLEPWRMG